MKKLFVIIGAAMLPSCAAITHNKKETPVKFLIKEYDERGLVSCVYIVPSGDTVGLDYLTTYGLKELYKGNIQNVYNK